MPDDETDSFVTSLVEDAVAPYARFLTAEAATHLREVVRLTLRTHPTAVRLVEEVSPRPDVLRSGDIPKDDTALGKQAGRG